MTDSHRDNGIWLKDLDHTHPGITPVVSGALCEAAGLCLCRHHTPPKEVAVHIDDTTESYRIWWVLPTQRVANAHAYEADATKDGAYALSLLCIEYRLHLVAIGQAEVGSGADWYVAPPGCGQDEFGAPNLDDPEVYRLEVSGKNYGTTGHRLHIKQAQLRRGDSALPGIAAVVGFARASVQVSFVNTEAQ